MAGKLVTVSGYLTNEVYAELAQSIQQKNTERACCLSAEIVVSGGAKNLVDWLISLIAQNYVLANGTFFRMIANALKMTSLGGNKWKDERVQNGICHVIVVLCSVNSQQTVLFKRVFTDETFLDSLHYMNHHNYLELEESLGMLVNTELYVYFVSMYRFLVEGSSKQVFKVLDFLNNKKHSSEHYVESSLMNPSSRGQNDVVWVCWKTLFAFCLTPNISDFTRQYVHTLYEVFSHNYTKKTKWERLNLLYLAFLVVAKRKEIPFPEVDLRIVEKACENIKDVYMELGELLKPRPKKSVYEDDDGKSASSNGIGDKPISQPISRKPPESSKQAVKQHVCDLPPKEKALRDLKLKVLFSYTHYPGMHPNDARHAGGSGGAGGSMRESG